jgi:hypothetical protein
MAGRNVHRVAILDSPSAEITTAKSITLVRPTSDLPNSESGLPLSRPANTHHEAATVRVFLDPLMAGNMRLW